MINFSVYALPVNIVEDVREEEREKRWWTRVWLYVWTERILIANRRRNYCAVATKNHRIVLATAHHTFAIRLAKTIKNSAKCQVPSAEFAILLRSFTMLSSTQTMYPKRCDCNTALCAVKLAKAWKIIVI